MSGDSHSKEISKLDLEITKLSDQISTLNMELQKKKQLRRRLVSQRLKGTEKQKSDAETIVEKIERKRKGKESKRILTRASERLTMGTKTFNKPCKKADYEKGAKRGKYICSKASDGYRYRPIGNPGDINYSNEDVVHAEGKSFKHTIGGKVGPRYGWDDIDRLRQKQIREYESEIKKTIKEEQMKPGGNVERAVALMSRSRFLRQAQEEGEGIIGDDDFKEPPEGAEPEPEPSPREDSRLENPSWKPGTLVRTSAAPKASKKRKRRKKNKKRSKKKKNTKNTKKR